MHIGILQTGHAAEPIRAAHGDYADMFERLLSGQGFRFTTWNVVDDAFPDSVHDAEGWLLTGSRHGAYDDLPFIPRLEAFIRDAFAEDVPLVGVCFGHQIIAQALGGKVEKFPGGWAVGRHDYAFGGETVTLNAWHQDQVTVAPEEATRVASSPFCENAGFVYGTRAFTVQAHPEFTPEVIRGLIESRGRGTVPDALLDAAAEALDEPVASPELGRAIGRFFRERRV
jgi:GMP synthase (glutamine-hydrolysing)